MLAETESLILRSRSRLVAESEALVCGFLFADGEVGVATCGDSLVAGSGSLFVKS